MQRRLLKVWFDFKRFGFVRQTLCLLVYRARHSWIPRRPNHLGPLLKHHLFLGYEAYHIDENHECFQMLFGSLFRCLVACLLLGGRSGEKVRSSNSVLGTINGGSWEGPDAG